MATASPVLAALANCVGYEPARLARAPVLAALANSGGYELEEPVQVLEPVELATFAWCEPERLVPVPGFALVTIASNVPVGFAPGILPANVPVDLVQEPGSGLWTHVEDEPVGFVPGTMPEDALADPE